MTALTDRMRTCAAHLSTIDALEISEAKYQAIIDAVELLHEASKEIGLLTGPIVPGHSVPGMGEPMEVIPPVVTLPPVVAQTSPMWVDPGGPLPGVTHSGTVSPRACPKCGSRANKRVTRVDKVMMLVCPVCAHEWAYKR